MIERLTSANNAPKLHEDLVALEDLAQDVDQLLPDIKMEGLNKDADGLYSTQQAEQVETSPIDSPYSEAIANQFLKVRFDLPSWTEADLERTEELSRFLKGKNVIDIGAGNSGMAYRIAQMAGARSYVAVEPYHFHKLHEELTSVAQEERMKGVYPILEQYPRIPFAVVGEDVRQFLQRLPDNSVSIFTFGLDDLVLRDMPREDYIEISKQYERVLDPDGVSMVDDVSSFGRVGKRIPKESEDYSTTQYFLYSKGSAQT